MTLICVSQVRTLVQQDSPRFITTTELATLHQDKRLPQRRTETLPLLIWMETVIWTWFIPEKEAASQITCWKFIKMMEQVILSILHILFLYLETDMLYWKM